MVRIRILGLVGSPRKAGSCAALVDAAFAGASAAGGDDVELQKVHVADYPVKPCTGCDACLRRPNECPLDGKDEDRGPALWEKLKWADVVLVAAPSYFHGVPGALKNVIDRTRPLKMQGHALKDKVFAPLTASGLRHSGAESVANALVEYAITQGMVVVGAVGHPVVEGNLPVATLQKEALKEFRGRDEADPIATAVAERLGARVFELAKKLRA
ncbi:MAG: flavodoxin family protein [Promethearchaeota archaeon]